MLEEMHHHQPSPSILLWEPLGCVEMWPMGCKTKTCHNLDIFFGMNSKGRWAKPSSTRYHCKKEQEKKEELGNCSCSA